MGGCVCVRACVRVRTRVCMCACVRACIYYACVRVHAVVRASLNCCSSLLNPLHKNRVVDTSM